MQKQIADQRSAAANTMSFINEEQKRADEARTVFQKYDVDHSNSIDRTELTNLLCDLGFPPEVIDVELATADSDGNNFVEWPEFVIYYNNLRERMKNGAVESAKKAVEARRSQHSELEELQKLQAALANQQAALEKRESEIAAKEAQIKRSSLSEGESAAVLVEARVAEIQAGHEQALQMQAEALAREQEQRRLKLEEKLRKRRKVPASVRASVIEARAGTVIVPANQ
eukprot:g1374.t1